MPRAALFHAPGSPFELREFSRPAIGPGDVLARVRLATICGSDLHTVLGRRSCDTPCALGHEIVGEVIALGEYVSADVRGEAIRVGDRITWGLCTHCGECDRCTVQGLPQKCRHGFKYGHASTAQPPRLTGGFADEIHLRPDTTLLRVPAGPTDAEVAPINCALATVAQAIEHLGPLDGRRVLVQGAGLLGLYACAWLRAADCAEVIVTETDARRLARAAEFGATEWLDVTDPDQVARAASLGVDAALELSGSPGALPLALEALRIGGRYVVAGLVYPDANVLLDGSRIVVKNLTVVGSHNYRPEHLGQAMDFLVHHRARFPFVTLVSPPFALADIDAAFAAAREGETVRVAVRP